MSDVGDVVERAMEVLAARPSALVSDIDGTLSHIVVNPQEADVSIHVKEALRRILPRIDLLAVITGREGSVARRMVGVEGLTYVASYGLGANEPAVRTEAIEAASADVVPFLPRLPGVTLELKDVSFALHYRNCPRPDSVRARLISIVEPIALQHGAKLLEGKLVLEVVPQDLPDKSTAFRSLLREHAIEGSIFVGDDLADAAIFREIRARRRKGRNGLAVGVIDPDTPRVVREQADLTLDGVDAVEAFLESLASHLSAERPLGR